MNGWYLRLFFFFFFRGLWRRSEPARVGEQVDCGGWLRKPPTDHRPPAAYPINHRHSSAGMDNIPRQSSAEVVWQLEMTSSAEQRCNVCETCTQQVPEIELCSRDFQGECMSVQFQFETFDVFKKTIMMFFSPASPPAGFDLKRLYCARWGSLRAK